MQEIFWHIKEAIDAYFGSRAFQITVKAGCFRAIKPVPAEVAVPQTGEVQVPVDQTVVVEQTTVVELGVVPMPLEVQVVGDSQEVLDQELAYARDGGLDYWIFLFHNAENWREGKNNYGLVQYLASSLRDQLSFSLMILPAQTEAWQRLTGIAVEMAKEPGYQVTHPTGLDSLRANASDPATSPRELPVQP